MFGDYTCIDADWFYEPVYDNVFGKEFNLYEMLFNSMATTTYIFNNTWTNEIIYLDKTSNTTQNIMGLISILILIRFIRVLIINIVI